MRLLLFGFYPRNKSMGDTFPTNRVSKENDPLRANITYQHMLNLQPGGKQGTLSYAFIKENIFFAGILCFQWLYYNDKVLPTIKMFWPIEYIFVFLPYVVRSKFSNLFPRTSFRDSMKNQTGKDQAVYYYMVSEW